MKVIAADIGGTKSWLVLVDAVSPAQHDIAFEALYASGDFPGFPDLLRHFLDQSGQPASTIERLCLAFPGPVKDREVSLTNLDWTIRAADIEGEFGIPQVSFINDFQAAALGTLELPPSDYVMLNAQPARPGGRRAVVGAGTGLGTAYMHWQDHAYRAFPTEAGHMSFAAQTEQQERLNRFLQGKYGHVSYERILSGQGLVDLYQFLGGTCPEGESASARWVNEQAGAGENPAARGALQLFARIYGAYASNIALAYKPDGGLYLVGGVTAKIRSWLESADFMTGYREKGRMRELVSGIPVYLVNNERIGLQGAIRYAMTEF